jgi:hypothetical protein
VYTVRLCWLGRSASVQLNGQYQGQATGETFNHVGKTDILIRHENKNVFVAECKFWGGYEGLKKTAANSFGAPSPGASNSASVPPSARCCFTQAG